MKMLGIAKPVNGFYFTSVKSRYRECSGCRDISGNVEDVDFAAALVVLHPI